MAARDELLAVVADRYAGDSRSRRRRDTRSLTRTPVLWRGTLLKAVDDGGASDLDGLPDWAYYLVAAGVAVAPDPRQIPTNGTDATFASHAA